jgi:hypothetical protein
MEQLGEGTAGGQRSGWFLSVPLGRLDAQLPGSWLGLMFPKRSPEISPARQWLM